MKREIALWTEWAWSEGWLLNDRQSIDSLVFTMVHTFKSRRPYHFGSFAKASEAIENDVRQVLKKLTYGLSKPQDLHPQRKAYLDALYSPSNRLSA